MTYQLLRNAVVVVLTIWKLRNDAAKSGKGLTKRPWRKNYEMKASEWFQREGGGRWKKGGSNGSDGEKKGKTVD